MAHAYDNLFTEEYLHSVFPAKRTDDFFEALYGNVEEGVYDIVLTRHTVSDDELHVYFDLHQRPGHCLVCNLTHGLPHVFERHPVIDTKGLVSALALRAGWSLDSVWWRVGETEETSSVLHRIPLVIMRYSQESMSS